MEDRHREQLRNNRVSLVRDLIVDENLLAYLEQNGILTQSMVEEIEVKPTKQKRASELLNVLTRRGPNAFGIFVDSLVCTSQTHLATMLEPGSGAQAELKHADPRHTVPLRVPSQPMDDTEIGILSVKVHPVDDIDAAQKINEGDVYVMSSQHRGRAVIISNEHFGNGHPNRDGSIWDLINLESLLRQLGFDTVTHTDLKAQEIEFKLEEERKFQKQSANAFFLCILSHGVMGHIFGVDGKTISIEQITTKFDGNHCPALTGKPKIFIIQACQGEGSTQGVPQADSEPENTDMAQMMKTLSIGDTADSMPTLPNVHEKADMVLAYSTVTGYKSWRLPESGSWYIRELVKIFANYAYKEHFMDLLVKVQNQVSEKHTNYDRSASSGLYVQMPETRTTLRKKLYLFPGYSC